MTKAGLSTSASRARIRTLASGTASIDPQSTGQSSSAFTRKPGERLWVATFLVGASGARSDTFGSASPLLVAAQAGVCAYLARTAHSTDDFVVIWSNPTLVTQTLDWAVYGALP